MENSIAFYQNRENQNSHLLSQPAKCHPNARCPTWQVHDRAAATQSNQPTNARSPVPYSPKLLLLRPLAPSPSPTREGWGRNTTPASGRAGVSRTAITSRRWNTAIRLLIGGLLVWGRGPSFAWSLLLSDSGSVGRVLLAALVLSISRGDPPWHAIT
ncbi:hypothetical protein BDZ85DRAFT_38106 [Elsinoe ampelina]|uniref:Uncharacterized protein n=1 Tax=Elsinoe ampelina TaxID=302913 RepID=A0A6A6G389_9PEZI|nr:hypothetical protein BDZ85DRAFT_38106 [Elsinoe ampelina]